MYTNTGELLYLSNIFLILVMVLKHHMYKVNIYIFFSKFLTIRHSQQHKKLSGQINAYIHITYNIFVVKILIHNTLNNFIL